MGTAGQRVYDDPMATSGKLPSWAVIVGVLGICFGALGTLSGAYGVLTPKMLSLQRELVVTMRQSMPAARQPAPGSTQPADPMDELDRLLSVPHWYARWALANSLAEMLIGTAYLLSALMLLMLRRGAPTAFMLAAGASLLRNVLSAGLALGAASLIAYWTLGSAVCGAVVDLALLATVALADKSVYRGAGSQAPEPSAGTAESISP